jgi:hypothetical protein
MFFRLHQLNRPKYKIMQLYVRRNFDSLDQFFIKKFSDQKPRRFQRKRQVAEKATSGREPSKKRSREIVKSWKKGVKDIR